MVLLGDEAHVEYVISVNLEIVLILTQNSFGCTRWNSLVTWVMWNHVSVRLETVFVRVQDRCTVWTKRTIGSEVILDALDGTPR